MKFKLIVSHRIKDQNANKRIVRMCANLRDGKLRFPKEIIKLLLMFWIFKIFL